MSDTRRVWFFGNASTPFHHLEPFLKKLTELSTGSLKYHWQAVETDRTSNRALKQQLAELTETDHVVHLLCPYGSLGGDVDLASAFRNDSLLRKQRERGERFFSLNLANLGERALALAKFLQLDIPLDQLDTAVTEGLSGVPRIESGERSLYEDRRLLLSFDDVLSDKARAAIDLRAPALESILVFDDEVPEKAGGIVLLIDAKMKSERFKDYLGRPRPGVHPTIATIIFSHFDMIHEYLSDPFYEEYLRNGRLKLWHASECIHQLHEQGQYPRNVMPMCNFIIAPKGHPLDTAVRAALAAYGKRFMQMVEMSTVVAAEYYGSAEYHERCRAVAEGAPLRIEVEQACHSVAIKQFSRNIAKVLQSLGHEVYIHPNCELDQRDVVKVTISDVCRFKPDLIIGSPNSFAKALYVPPTVKVPMLIALQDLQPHQEFPGYVERFPMDVCDMVLLMQDRFAGDLLEAGLTVEQVVCSALPTEEPLIDPSDPNIEEKWDVGLVKTMDPLRDLVDLVKRESPVKDLSSEELEHIRNIDKLIRNGIDSCAPVGIEAIAELSADYPWYPIILQFAHEYMCLHYMTQLHERGFQMGLSGANWDKIPHLRGYALQHISDRVLYQRRFLETKINISMNPWNEYHPRVLDGGRCGAFFLVYQVPEAVRWQTLPSDLVAGEHYDVFSSPEELAEKCAYYLEHPDKRRAMGERLKECVSANHSYEHMGELLVERFRSLLRKRLEVGRV